MADFAESGELRFDDKLYGRMLISDCAAAAA